jgi:CAAX prenyl protease-like protein
MALLRSRAVPYVLPFVLFIAILAMRGYLAIPNLAVATFWIVVVGGAVLLFSRSVVDLGLSRPLATIGIGIAVFFIWIGPDVLIPGYRSHWLFQNRLTGALALNTSNADQTDFVLITLRVARAVVVVPVVEELFWRGFLMRWIVQPDFEPRQWNLWVTGGVQ